MISVESIQKSRTTFHEGHAKKVHTVAWSPDGRRLASGGQDRSVILWDLNLSGKKSAVSQDQELKGHTEAVDQLTWDPTHSDLLASTSADKSVRIWDARSGKCAANVPTKGENLNISWCPSGNTIAVGNKEDQVTFIDRRKTDKAFAAVGNPYAFKTEVNEIGWNNSGTLFFMTTGNGTVDVYNYPGQFKDDKLLTLQAHTQNCYCIRFCPRDKYFAVGGADALVSIWDLATFTCVNTVSRLEWPVRTLGFSADGNFIAAGSEDHYIDVSSVETGEQVHRIQCDAATNALHWHPKLPLLAFGCDREDRDQADRRDAAPSEGCVRIFGPADLA